MQVKIFVSSSKEKLESQINDWLEENDVKILEFQSSISHSVSYKNPSSSSHPFSSTEIMTVIAYEE